MTETSKRDTRFFPGYAWVCERPDCKLGLCMPGTTAREAVDSFLRGDRKKNWLAGKPITLWVMFGPDDVPIEIKTTI